MKKFVLTFLSIISALAVICLAAFDAQAQMKKVEEALGGKNGVISLLRAKGYKIEAIKL